MSKYLRKPNFVRSSDYFPNFESRDFAKIGGQRTAFDHDLFQNGLYERFYLNNKQTKGHSDSIYFWTSSRRVRTGSYGYALVFLPLINGCKADYAQT